MATMHFWLLYQLNIKNVFFHGNLAEEVYMEQPPSFVAQGSLVWCVAYSLCSSKHSPQAWFGRFSSMVQELWHDPKHKERKKGL